MDEVSKAPAASEIKPDVPKQLPKVCDSCACASETIECRRMLRNAQYTPQRVTILEALSATGLRSIRYAKEIPLVK